jgi:hypothetical protein
MTGQYLVKNQTRTGDPTPYDEKLAGAIEEVFGGGRHDLAGLVGGLNELGLLAPGGEPWTEQSFQDEMSKRGQS